MATIILKRKTEKKIGRVGLFVTNTGNSCATFTLFCLDCERDKLGYFQ